MLPTADIHQLPERIICSITAAAKVGVPTNIILAIAEKEDGKPGLWVKNKNGTFDVGYMQFNTSYLKELHKYGILPEHVAASGCYSFELAAWRIKQHITYDSGDFWTKVANYHSRTPAFNSIYRNDLMHKSMKWATWLEKRFPSKTANKSANQTKDRQILAAKI